IGVTGLTLEQAAKKAGEKDTWSVNWFNQTPWEVPRAQLRAYTQEKGKQPVLVEQKEIRMGTPWDAQNLGFWRFSCAVPSQDYDLIVTVNMYYQGGSWVKEPLAVKNPNTGQYVLYGQSGHMETRYDDNVVSKGMTGAPPPPPPGGDGEQPSTNDLAVTYIDVLDANRNSVGTTLSEGKTYYVRATFSSGFDVGGWGVIRLYRYDASQRRLYECGNEGAYFSPKGTVTKDFGMFGWGAGTYTLIATVDYYNNGDDPSSGWRTQKFDGKYDEKTYDNNRKDLQIGVGQAPPREPQPVQGSEPVWFPPLVTKTVPVYKTVYQTVWKDHWVKLDIWFENGTARIVPRLVPNSPPS
ncbi:MAG: hypothetical protein AB1508_19230, partial [Pseudomonadota bacterium]